MSGSIILNTGASLARDETLRIAGNSDHIGLTREEAEAIVRARGVNPPAAGNQQAVYTPPTYDAAAYDNINVDGEPLPVGVDATVAVEAGKVLGYALNLDPILASAITKDLVHAGKVDPAQVKTIVENAGQDYAELIQFAGTAIARGALRLGKELPIKPAELPAHSLIQLGVLEKLKAKRESR